MKPNLIWATVSISLLSAIATADMKQSDTIIEMPSFSVVVKNDISGGVEIFNQDGTVVYLTKEQVGLIKKINLKKMPELKNASFCAKL